MEQFEREAKEELVMQAANSIDVGIGSRLIELRQQHGLTVSILAPFAGMSEAELETAERGLRRLTSTQIFGLCQALGIRPSDLYRAPDYEAILGRSFLSGHEPEQTRLEASAPLS